MRKTGKVLSYQPMDEYVDPFEYLKTMALSTI